MSKLVSSGKSLGVSGKKISLKVHSTYYQEEIPSSNKKRRSQAVSRISCPPLVTNTSVSRRHHPLYQTIVLKNSKAIKCKSSDKTDRKRSRYLIKKYGLLWIHKVFGRVSPCQARYYYTRRVIKNSFMIWYDEWWTSKKEWKLIIRADCHNRYRLWHLIWKSWREYMKQNQKKRQTESLAQYHANYHVKQRVLITWLQYTMYKTKRSKQMIVAMDFFQCNLKRIMLKKWYYNVLLHNKKKIMKNTASSHYTHTTQYKMWSCWKMKFQMRMNIHIQESVSDNHYKIFVMRKLLNVWNNVILMNRKQKEMKIYAVSHYHSVLLYKCFRHWSVVTCNTKYIIELLEVKGHMMRLRRYFLIWRQYITLKQYKYLLINISTDHYKHVLKSKGLQGLIQYVRIQQTTHTMGILANSHYHITIIRQVWKIWLQKCEDCEEIKLHSLTIRARHKYKQWLLYKCISNWIMYIDMKKNENLLNQFAIQHYKMKILPKCLKAFKEYVLLSHYQHETRSKTIDFRRSVLLSMTFYHWWRESVYHYHNRLYQDMAVQHYQHHLIMSFMNYWRQATRTKQHVTKLQHIATTQYFYTLQYNAFFSWKKEFIIITQRHNKYEEVKKHYNNNLLMRYWKGWRLFLSKTHQFYDVISVSKQHYDNVLLNKCIRAWKNYHKRSCVMSVKSERATIHYKLVLKRRVVLQWKENVHRIQHLRNMLLLSLQYQRHSILKKGFNIWWNRTNQLLEQVCEEERRVVNVQNVLNRALLRRLFSKWYQKYREKYIDKNKRILANEQYNNRLLCRVLHNWILYHEMIRKKKILKYKCGQFNRVRLVSMYYTQWRLQLMEALVMKQKNSLALWKWSHTLQYNMFCNWILYVMKKKRKAKRYIDAMDAYRTQLLADGVSQWIKVATSIQAYRSEQAYRQHIKDTSYVWRCVKRCALHWRHVTIIRRKNSGVCVSCDHNRIENDIKLKEQTSVVLMNDVTSVELMKTKANHNTDYWEQLMKDLNIPEFTTQLRPPPRKPDYLYTITPCTVSTSSTLDSVPVLTVPHPITPPVLSESISSISSSNHGNTNVNVFVKPDEWKLLPPSVFTQPFNRK